ncbi:O-antigen ligase family protein [Agrococcus sp. KRD186]|uniref:O-antigen ligase family protein n=1 Tax=Agrococcus sp. KRD186 TaxID=2729730 RepID=UPI0019D29283|nr:O-antigen ligase family protein [Agrococcus sp. KRD186]
MTATTQQAHVPPAPLAREPFHVHLGTALLFGLYVALLAGRFTLDRISSSLPALDLRLAAIYAIGLAWMWWFAVAHRYVKTRLPHTSIAFFLAWLSWMAMSAGWAPAGARTADNLLDLGLLAGFLLLGFHLMAALPAQVVARLWTWVFWTGVIYFAAAMLEGPGAQGRYSAFGGGPNVFVRIMLLAAIAALFLTASRKKSWPLFAVPLFAVGAALSGSRGGLLSAAIVVVLFLIPIVQRLGGKRFLRFGLAAGVVAAIAAASDGGAIFRFVQDRYIQQTIVEGYTSGRTSIFEQILVLYNQNPVGGVGLDGYYALQPRGSVFEYPHNLLLATAGEGGSIGAALLIGTLAAFAIAATRVRPMQPAAFTALLAGAYLLFASMFSGDYYDSRFMWFFLAVAATVTTSQRDHIEDRLEERDLQRT